MKGITKRFPGVLALNNVDFELYPSEICGLIGENGAGKSTLMRILAGIFTADEGEIRLDSEPVKIGTVNDSLALGVSVIHQELNLAPNLDIQSNIFLGREPRMPLLGVVDRKTLHAKAAELAKRVGISAPLNTLVEKLSPGEQQLVEVAKALSADARILVLDEPTSSLTPTEAEKLFAVMRKLKASGVSMIYISHRLAEVEEMCDRCVVLRDGQRVGELSKGHITPSEMVKLMVGRDISRFFPQHAESQQPEVALSVRNLSYPGSVGMVTFELRAGEILGVAGLIGAGRTELMRAIFGVERTNSGYIVVSGQQVRINSPADAIRAGICLVPEDRKELGVILEMGVTENITLPGIGTYRPPFMDRRREKRVATEQAQALEIKTPNLAQDVQFLSGGNQQKVALGKWLSMNPKILILDEPTRGIDVGSKSEIYKLIRALADKGVAVIIVSSELEEVIGLSDRVLVMHEGRCTGIVGREEISEENIMKLATGGISL
jgi:ribose transport system ATP-binding protein